MPSTYVVLDTNAWLHFSQPSDIDWAEVVGDASPQLVVPYTVLQELDEKRYSSRSEVLIRRSAAASRFIAGAIESGDPGLMFLSDSPHDWAEGRLQHTVADDRLIAELRAMPVTEGQRIVVVTSDLTLRVKLRVFGIEHVELPDRYKLPDEADTQLRVTKSKLAKLESASPRFSIAFDNGTNSFEVTLPSESVVSEDDVERRRLVQRAAHYHAIDASKKHLYDADAQEKYDERWRLFDIAFTSYLRTAARYEHRRISLTFAVNNLGDVRATGVSISLVFPENMRVRWKPLFSILLAPDPPQSPPLKGETRPNEALRQALEQFDALAKRDEPGYRWNRILELRIPSRKAKFKKSDDGATTASYVIGNMSQGEAKLLRTVQVELSDGDPRRFGVRWTAHAENMVGSDTGTCVVAITEPDSASASA